MKSGVVCHRSSFNTPLIEIAFITVYHHHGMITTGLVWQYTRSSMTYPIMLPPFCDPVDGHLLLDGCFVNNMPGLTIWGLNTPTDWCTQNVYFLIGERYPYKVKFFRLKFIQEFEKRFPDNLQPVAFCEFNSIRNICIVCARHWQELLCKASIIKAFPISWYQFQGVSQLVCIYFFESEYH